MKGRDVAIPVVEDLRVRASDFFLDTLTQSVVDVGRRVAKGEARRVLVKVADHAAIVARAGLGRRRGVFKSTLDNAIAHSEMATRL